MSIVHVGHIRNAVLTRFGHLVDLSDVQNAPPEQLESYRLTRGLAAFAVAELRSGDGAQARRFLPVHGPIHNLFRVGRHHLKATHQRLLRERAFSAWKTAMCVLKGE